ncbi:MAG: hypothetical protein K2J90_10530 [Lachnospiraceae bacterium]|nr:hypothetical protein [Lachnospiraceae bacterium]
MKFRYFLRGLGLGILFSSIIFLAAYQGNSAKKLTDDEIIRRAKELGMVEEDTPLKGLLSSEEKTSEKNGEKNTTNENDTTQDSSVEESTKQDAASTTEEKTSEESSQKESDSAQATTEKEDTDQNKEKVTLTIEGGASSYPVCQRLQELGMIDSAEEFDSYLVEQGYASRIRVGTHTLSKGMSFYEIAEAISDPL